jgi:NAD(P)-dependent dehydrogenase (short-subunit alcohol dehydrogenase family)
MKVAIVTGATQGIGRATALALGAAGWWVLASGRDEVRGKQVAEELRGLAGGEFLPMDLGESGATEEIVARAVGERRRLDCVVNNAGIHFLASVEQTSRADYERLMAINLTAAFLLARAAIPLMRKSGGGVIVNVSSEAGVVAVPGQAAYNISKAAMLMLTRSLAVDHADDGIRAVSVCPGTIRTPLVEEAIASAEDPAAHQRWLESSRPAKRLGKPEEIAAVIAFAASDEASYMTGSEIVVDGGYTAV